MGGGLYGPIVVLEPGETYNPETDRTLFFGTAGYIESFIVPPPKVVLNGSDSPAPMELKANTKYRFRLFNLAGDNPTEVRLTSGATPVNWRAVGKGWVSLAVIAGDDSAGAFDVRPGRDLRFRIHAHTTRRFDIVVWRTSGSAAGSAAARERRGPCEVALFHLRIDQ
jgi:hypothetical protein